MGRGAFARTGLAAPPTGETAPGFFPWLSQRRAAADVSQFTADRSRAGRSIRFAAGDPVLQTERTMARERTGRSGSDGRAGGLWVQVDQVADARIPHEPVPCQRY